MHSTPSSAPTRHVPAEATHAPSPAGRRWPAAVVLAVLGTGASAQTQELAEELSGGVDSAPLISVQPRALGAGALPPGGLLLVPDSTNDRVMAFDPATGDLRDANFIPSDPTRLSVPIHALLGPDRTTILVSDQLEDVVQQFDLATGAFVRTFAPVGGADTGVLDNVRGMLLREDGHLLVTTAEGGLADAVVEFDASGALVGTLIGPGAGGLADPFAISRTADGYRVSGALSAAVHAYTTTGDALPDFAAIDRFPEQLQILSDGTMLVANFDGVQEGIVELDGAGNVLAIQNPTALGGYRGVFALPNGHLLVTNSNGVHEIDRVGNLIETKLAGVSAHFIELARPPVAVRVDGGPLVLDEGQTAVFEVVLETAPSSDVVIDLLVSDAGEISTGASQLTFTTANFSTPQTVVVTGVLDDRLDGSQSARIDISVNPEATDDPGYAALAAQAVMVTVQDIDSASVAIADSAVVEGDVGTTLQRVSVTLSGNVEGGFSLPFATVAGSASAGSDFAALAGTLVFAGGDGEVREIEVVVLGDTRVELDETYTLSLGSPSNPAVVLADGLATARILNDDQATLSVSDASIAEGDAGTRLLNFVVTLSGAVDGGFSVDYASADLSARAGEDYEADSGSLAFAGSDGEVRNVSIVVSGDRVVEPDEQFELRLAAISRPAVSAADGVGTGTLENDDSASLSIDDVTLTEGDSGTATALFEVSLSGAVAGGVGVSFATANGSALAGVDYLAAAGVLQFAGADGEVQQVAVEVSGDLVVEPDRQFFVDLDSVSEADVSLADARAVGTILDNDGAQLRIGDASVLEGDSGTVAMRFPVSLTAPVAGGLTVTASTAPGSASAEEDYLSGTSTLSFAGTLNEVQIFEIQVRGDRLDELDETFRAVLSGVSNPAVTLADAEADGTITDDDATGLLALELDLDAVDESGGIALLTGSFDLAADRVQCADIVLGGDADAGDYAIEDGDAQQPGVQLCLAGDALSTRASLAVSAVDDLIHEGEERLSFASAGAAAELRIVDNEPEPTIGLSLSAGGVREGGAVELRITPQPRTDSPLLLSLQFSGSAEPEDFAIADADPVRPGIQVTVPAGAAQAALAIAALEDDLSEGAESLTIGASLDDGPGAVAGTVTLFFLGELPRPITVPSLSVSGLLLLVLGVIGVLLLRSRR
jgi:hypothetical protein